MNASIESENISFENTATAFSAQSNQKLRKTFWLFAAMNQPWLVKLGTTILKLAFRLRVPLIPVLVKKTLFEHFCGGESIIDSQKTIDALDAYAIGTILDYSVEGEKTEEGFEKTTQEIIRTIEKAKQESNKIPFSVFKVTGVAPFYLLEKVQAKAKLSETEKKSWENVKNRVLRICQKASDYQVRLFIDAEESWIQESIDDLTYEMMQKFNRKEVIVYNTYQLYLKASLGNLKQALNRAEKEGYYLGAKLVRGAYMEKERERAEEKNEPDPVQANKQDTDKDFDEAVLFCLDNYPNIAICAGTHNEESNLMLIKQMQERNIDPSNTLVYFAQLFGMSDHISFNLAQAGYNVAKYVPYGPVASVMPYLFRRAEENTSVAGQSSREFKLVKAEFQRRRKKKKTN